MPVSLMSVGIVSINVDVCRQIHLSLIALRIWHSCVISMIRVFCTLYVSATLVIWCTAMLASHS